MKPNLILVINCGSSSLKFSLMSPDSGAVTLSGLAEKLGATDASITIKYNDAKIQQPLPAPFNHETAINQLVDFLAQEALSHSIKAIGHRVVHGGETYHQPTLINDNVKQEINRLARLAPLHNPANLTGINVCQTIFSSLPQVAIFDTAFHQTMPQKAFIYGIPFKLYQEHGIRRYGFHGTSHDFVTQQAAKLLDKPISQCSFISAHLGNGCSVVALKDGKSVDTSLGLTPLEGLVMGTRSGDVDPGIIFHLVEQLGYSIEDVNSMLNKKSGLLGISQISNDCRELETAALDNNDPQALLALNVFAYRIAKSIASFSAALTQLDGLIFTGGIGENSSYVRELVISQLSLLNFAADHDKNDHMRFGNMGEISSTNSRKCWVIPTNEEWVIAQQSAQLLNSNK